MKFVKLRIWILKGLDKGAVQLLWLLEAHLQGSHLEVSDMLQRNELVLWKQIGCLGEKTYQKVLVFLKSCMEF